MNAMKLTALCLLLAGPMCRAADTASIEGRVQLQPTGRSRVSSARYRGAAGKPAQPDPAAAVVYLDGARGTAEPKTVEVVQKGMQFRPTLLPVQVGAKVVFPNADDFYHNVFSYSRSKRFDLGRFMKDETPPAVRFDQPGEVKVFCEIHRHMRGTILVLDTPYFVKTDAAGNYSLKGVPAGTYRLKAWLDSKTVFERTVEIKPGAKLRVDFPES